MAAIDFPNSPTNGQVFTSGELSWTYQTGVGWLLNSAASVAAQEGWNKAWGVVASAVRTTSGSGIGGGAYVDIAGLAVTFTAKAGRRYVATVHLTSVYSTTSDWIALRIQKGDGSVTYGGTQEHNGGANAGFALTCVTAPLELAAGSQTIKTAIYFGSGAGGFNAAADLPLLLTVEDVGPTTQSPITDPTPNMQWNAAWGVVAVGSPAAGQVNVPTNGQNVALTNGLVFNPVVGRRYRAVFSARAMQPTLAHGTSTLILAKPNNGYYHNTSDRWYQSQFGQGYGHQSISWVIDSGAPADTLRVLISSATNTGMTVFPTEFYIEDIGPAAFAVPIENPMPDWMQRVSAPNAFCHGQVNGAGISAGAADGRALASLVVPVCSVDRIITASYTCLGEVTTMGQDWTLRSNNNIAIAYRQFSAAISMTLTWQAVLSANAAHTISGNAPTGTGTFNTYLNGNFHTLTYSTIPRGV